MAYLSVREELQVATALANVVIRARGVRPSSDVLDTVDGVLGVVDSNSVTAVRRTIRWDAKIVNGLNIRASDVAVEFVIRDLKWTGATVNGIERGIRLLEGTRVDCGRNLSRERGLGLLEVREKVVPVPALRTELRKRAHERLAT